MKGFVGLILYCGIISSGYAQTSLFESGPWWKIATKQHGVHKIDRALLQDLGVDLESFDPQTIKLYAWDGNGELPQLNALSSEEKIREVATSKTGLSDGSFDVDDFILFYGDDPDYLDWESGSWNYRNNIYADESYYFLTIGGSPGLDVEDLPSEDNDFPTVRKHRAVAYHELDEQNILKSGKKWFGEALRSSVLTRPFEFETPDIIDSAYITAYVMVQTTEVSTISVLQDSEELGTMEADAIRDGIESPYSLKGYEVSNRFGYQPTEGNQVISIRLSPPSGNSGSHVAYIDRLILDFDQTLRYSSGSFHFSGYGLDTLPGHRFEIESDVEELLIWQLDDSLVPGNIQYDSNEDAISFGRSNAYESRFVVFDPSGDLPVPETIGPVSNQNIQSMDPKNGLIISHASIIEEARKLASFHRTFDGLDVEVVTVEEIYQEFSGGRQDVSAIRNAVRHYWKKNPESFRYLLLFGDCSYDYKDRISNNTNYVPIYESLNSLDPVSTYSSDDFFGFMDDTEGNWLEGINYEDHTLEVGVGRIPAKTPREAEDVVSKIILYATSSDPGNWKNEVTYVVDDGDRNIHVVDAEDLSGYLDEYHGQLSLNKLYLDAFEQEGEEDVQSAPAVNELLANSLTDGTFLINYIGHGSEARWAEETVFQNDDIDDLRNRFRLPVFVTATCEFGRYDDPAILTPGSGGISGAEKLLLNPDGGAIALLTTTRPVFAFSNFFVNAAFHNFFYQKDLRLGDIIRLTKNNSLSGVRNRNFSLLGDPMLKLQYPAYDIQLDSTVALDTLQGLREIQLNGSIRDSDNQIIENFNGQVEVKLFDRPSEKNTLGQESSPFVYRERDIILFNGKFSVNQGEFRGSFIVPENVSQAYEKGQMTFFAQSSDSKEEASGFTNEIRLGGISSANRVDNQAPEIHAYINDSTFSPSDRVGRRSLFIADISDDYGLNTSSIGGNRNMTLTINDTLEIVVNEYYQASLDNSRRGQLIFPLDLEVSGTYRVELKVWDLYNNSASESVEFVVSGNSGIQLYNFSLYPNPTETVANFSFDHDRRGESLDLAFSFYNPMGRLLHVEEFEWDNTPSSIDGLQVELPQEIFQNGLYLFRFRIKSREDGATSVRVGKLIISK